MTRSLSAAPTAADRDQGRLAPGLYLVATPLGNLGDITRRAITTLERADLIACEDTRVTRRLCAALGIAAPRLVRYDDHADESVRARLVAAMRDGKAVALVSDAGSPLIADPGYRLVGAARDAQVAVTAVPGPSAAIAALMLSGLPTDRFLFAGFLPRGQRERRDLLAELGGVRATLVLFGSPHRLGAELAALAGALGMREAAVVREITKLHEDVVRGPLPDLAARFATTPARGEIAIVVAPPAIAVATVDDDTVDAALRAALRGQSVRDAVTQVAAQTGRKRADVYARALALAGR